MPGFLPPAETGQSETSPDLVDLTLTLIRDQLSASEAAELVFYASDDPTMFCALALGKVQRGTLAVPPEVRAALHRGLGGFS